MFERLLNGLTLAQAVGPAQTTADAAKAAQTSAWVLFLLVAAVIVLPFVIGTFLSRALRMKDVSMRIGLVLFTLFLAVTPFAWRLVEGRSLKDALRLGIDLAGGSDLIFQVDTEKAQQEEKKITPQVMQRLIPHPLLRSS